MIRFENVCKTYANGGNAVIDINLHIKQGEFICLIGPSGCGKTSTLKMINRLQDPTSGQIFINNKNIMEQDPVMLRRGIGYVVQQIGLFPHMTIAENIGVVPKLLGWPPERWKERAEELLTLVGLDPKNFSKRYPMELSGGQQQRVGVLRALAAQQELVLMDEPFGALDPITRESLQDELKRLQKQLNKTIVFVTHDMDEAVKLADRIVLMKEGRILQLGTPYEFVHHPANEFVKEFMRSFKNKILDATLVDACMEPLGEEIHLPLPVVSLGTSIEKALQIMFFKRVDKLYVINEEQVKVGYLTRDKLSEYFNFGEQSNNSSGGEMNVS
ncbi:osmoprotectant transport system ATP-binding protein [Paenibacillus sp. yr247]|uniref:ABC transporter ATP-binding protein n=1 Tax=Paenibacillus sp. yr247 TaxID=1761880 RepID=UPI0008860E52|nr:betaine/proline/choline family ABC transporter ATP-binding protein [Paenibacillus sp. yr247]SDO33279.1 osmoprotectant transport system ATP-binding protein [Paenibacillus sp. yr247]